MSQRQDKKQRKVFRQEAKKILEKYSVGLNEKLKSLDHILKERPKWCPRFLWAWGVGLFIDLKKIRTSQEVKVPSKKN